MRFWLMFWDVAHQMAWICQTMRTVDYRHPAVLTTITAVYMCIYIYIYIILGIIVIKKRIQVKKRVLHMQSPLRSCKNRNKMARNGHFDQ
jgi:hypothetical protein